MPSPLLSYTLAPVQIHTSGWLEVRIDGRPLRFEGRGPRKPLELLSLLVTCGPRGADVSAIADLLWLDADGFDAYRALITTLHRLRRLLTYRCAVRLGAGRLSLEPALCDIDVWRLEGLLEGARTRAQLEAALEHYGGSFLGTDPNPWSVGMRTRLERAVARAALKLQVAAREPGRSEGLAPAVRHRLSPLQIHTASKYGEHRDVSASPRCRVADRRMDRGSE